jgi:hypothetical protein
MGREDKLFGTVVEEELVCIKDWQWVHADVYVKISMKKVGANFWRETRALVVVKTCRQRRTVGRGK